MPERNHALEIFERTLEWCEQHPHPDRETLESSPMVQAWTDEEFEAALDPAEFDAFTQSVRDLVKRERERGEQRG